MLITKEHQEQLIKNYIDKKYSTDQCTGFMDGVESIMELIGKLYRAENAIIPDISTLQIMDITYEYNFITVSCEDSIRNNENEQAWQFTAYVSEVKKLIAEYSGSPEEIDEIDNADLLHYIQVNVEVINWVKEIA